MQDQYVWSPVYVDAMIERDTPTQRLYVQQDADWNVTALVNTSGSVVERYVYDPYGSVTYLNATWGTISSSAYSWIYLYQDGRLDNATALYSFRKRDYSGTLARWLEDDPLSFDAGDSNFYRFVGNDPAANTDSSGLQINPVQPIPSTNGNNTWNNIAMYKAQNPGGPEELLGVGAGAVIMGGFYLWPWLLRGGSLLGPRGRAVIATGLGGAGGTLGTGGPGSRPQPVLPTRPLPSRPAPRPLPQPQLPPLRQDYFREVDALPDVAARMRAAGNNSEEIGRRISQMRRDIGVKYKDLTPPDMQAKIYERNMRLYGDKLGPTVDWLQQQGYTWEQIIEKACRPGGHDLGLGK
jgi:RHS repeat-associated protein